MDCISGLDEKSGTGYAALSGTISVSCDNSTGTLNVSIDGAAATSDTDGNFYVTESTESVVVTVTGIGDSSSDVKITVTDGADDSNTKEFTVSSSALTGEESNYTATLELTGTFSSEDGTLTLTQSDDEDSSVNVTLS